MVVMEVLFLLHHHHHHQGGHGGPPPPPPPPVAAGGAHGQWRIQKTEIGGARGIGNCVRAQSVRKIFLGPCPLPVWRVFANY